MSGVVYGYDMTAVVAVAETMGYGPLAVGLVASAVESGMVAGLAERRDDGGGAKGERFLGMGKG